MHQEYLVEVYLLLTVPLKNWDVAEGNDIFVGGTSDGVEVEIVGGLGSDTFNVGGNDGEEITVVSNGQLVIAV